MQNHQKVITYSKLGKISLKKGLFGSLRDPSVDLEHEITVFLSNQKHAFNSRVKNTFDLNDGTYTKYEFFWIPPRAQRVSSAHDKIDNAKVAFRSMADVSLVYMKDRSIILFQTSYRFAVTEPGCGRNGVFFVSGGTNFEQEEIYFNKITTVGARHKEETYEVLNEGCGGGKTGTYISERDGFVIRSGEAFHVFASQKHNDELKDARSQINQKISETN